MKVLVQKYGGTSLSTHEARACAVSHICSARRDGYRLVVVVSAMGRKNDPYATDTLLDHVLAAYARSPARKMDHGAKAHTAAASQDRLDLPARELDLLMSCGEVISAVTMCAELARHQIESVVLTGAQAGIMTDGVFGNARIVHIKPDAIIDHLSEGRVVLVTGFQGDDGNGNVTTLGRGGSDTTAASLAARLQAERVDIFTDVDGILTADPRIVQQARRLETVTYAEICNMAIGGAKVVHPRAVEVAMQASIPMRVRSTFSTDAGTLVTGTVTDHLNEHGNVMDVPVTGIAFVSGISQIRIEAPHGKYDLQLDVFKAMAKHRISVDFINVSPSGIVYTVWDRELEQAIRIVNELGYEPIPLQGCAKVSVIGGGMNGVPGIMAKIVEALTEQDIRILQTADSNATIWVLVESGQAENAVRALHRIFQLHRRK